MKGEKYLFVVSGPSGTGKDTVVAALLKKHPEIQHTVSATTRSPREGEKDGINYHFMSVADFEDHLANDQIVEHTKYCENYYGTLRSEIEGRMKLGIPVILVIEVEGAGNIKKMYPGATTIFVLPPDMQELERRLDNVVYRMGFAMTRRQARQLVSHAHFTVNGKKVNIPSYLVKAGDVIEVAESSRSSEVFKRLMGQDAPVFLVPTWMERDKNSLKGTVVRLPAREEIDVPVEEHLIVELYSK